MNALIGRPPATFDKEAAIELACQGTTRKKIAEALGCSDRHLYRLLLADASFSRDYNQARELGAEALVESLLSIVEDNPGVEDVNVLRLKSDNIKFCAVKLFPHKYGDRLEIKHGYVDIGSALSEAKQRVTIDITPALPDPFE